MSMQHGGSSKDVWVLASPARPRRSRASSPASSHRPRMVRACSRLSSRVAENFFWLGRYSERADAAARLGRETLAPGRGW